MSLGYEKPVTKLNQQRKHTVLQRTAWARIKLSLRKENGIQNTLWGFLKVEDVINCNEWNNVFQMKALKWTIQTAELMNSFNDSFFLLQTQLRT